MLDKDLMKKTINKVYNTEEFKKAESKKEKYEKISKNANTATIAIGLPFAAAAMALVCSDNISLEQVENLTAGAGIGLGATLNPMIISTITQRKAFNQEEKIMNLIKDEYMLSCMEKDLVENGYTSVKARQRAESIFENMSKEDKENNDKEFNKLLKIYEIVEEKPFNYKDFIELETEQQVTSTIESINKLESDGSEMEI